MNAKKLVAIYTILLLTWIILIARWRYHWKLNLPIEIVPNCILFIFNQGKSIFNAIAIQSNRNKSIWTFSFGFEFYVWREYILYKIYFLFEWTDWFSCELMNLTNLFPIFLFVQFSWWALSARTWSSW